MLRISSLIGLVVLAIGVNGYTYYPSVQQHYQFYTTPQVWFDARQTCRSTGGHLAMPRNDAEAAVLTQIFSQHPASSLPGISHPNHFLLNFHDLFREGEYVTDKGIAIQYYFHKWGYPPQPDNLGGEHCSSFYRPGTINDYPCEVPAVFVCQKNKPEIFVPDKRCATSDSEYQYSTQTGKCYKLHLNPRAWPEARAICKAEGGNLAIINSKAEEDFLVKMLAVPEDRVTYVQHLDYALIGFHDLFRENNFVTVEGDDLKSIGYANWGTNEPNNLNGEHCGTMHFTGILNDFPCDVPAVFICEINGNKFGGVGVGVGVSGNTGKDLPIGIAIPATR